MMLLRLRILNFIVKYVLPEKNILMVEMTREASGGNLRKKNLGLKILTEQK